jgi:hypothetical protein
MGETEKISLGRIKACRPKDLVKIFDRQARRHERQRKSKAAPFCRGTPESERGSRKQLSLFSQRVTFDIIDFFGSFCVPIGNPVGVLKHFNRWCKGDGKILLGTRQKIRIESNPANTFHLIWTPDT